MSSDIENWKTQIRKGYLEICILQLVRRYKQLYGFDLIEKLAASNLNVKEGTVYPLLNRMSADGLLVSNWETENLRGHPRKFYSLTKAGLRVLSEMDKEFEDLIETYRQMKSKGNEK